MNDDPAKQAWQASVQIAGVPPLDEVHKGAGKFYRFVWWRNMTEYAACVVTVACFGAYVFTLPDILQRVGSAMVVVATFYVGWQLHRRASAVEPPEKAGTMPLYAFMRAQFVRHRDALRSMFWWYVLPFIPGVAVMLIGSARAHPPGNPWVGWLLLAGMTAFIGGIVWLNGYFARNLQRHIDEIDALVGVSDTEPKR